MPEITEYTRVPLPAPSDPLPFEAQLTRSPSISFALKPGSFMPTLCSCALCRTAVPAYTLVFLATPRRSWREREYATTAATEQPRKQPRSFHDHDDASKNTTAVPHDAATQGRVPDCFGISRQEKHINSLELRFNVLSR